jgi:hypothetical protein
VVPEALTRSAFVAELMDTQAARADFAESSLVAGWPEALRGKTMAFEPWQRIVNGQLASPDSAESRIGDLHAVLTRTDLRALPLWMLGSSPDEQRIARALDPRLARDPEVQQVLGIGALVDRDYRAAIGHFRQARAGDGLGRLPRAALLEVFTLCLEGELERAALLARRLVSEVPATAREDAHWRFLETTYGLADPRRS